MPEHTFLIITLNNHPNLGPLLIPYFARTTLSQGILEIEEQAVHVQKDGGLSETEKKIISIAQSYSEKNLMHVYSRERLIADFLRNLKDDLRKNIIRPFIDKKLREMIRLIRSIGLPVYIRDTGVKLLYDHNRVELSEEDVEASFRFEINEQFFRYSADCKRDGMSISLKKKKPVLILSLVPAILLLGNELLVFKRINASRLTPFLEKDYVEVPVSEAYRYLEKVALPIIAGYPAKTIGFDLMEKSHECRAELSIERSINDQPVLQLRFRYGSQYFAPGQKMQRTYPRLEEQEGKPLISYFTRHQEQEECLVAELKERGFKQITDTQFAWSGDASAYALVDWIREYREELQERFTFVETASSLRFYLGEVILKQEITSVPDWFEIRILVRIGDYQYPFIRFKKQILEGKREFILPDNSIVLLPEDWFDKYSDLFTFGNEDKEEIRVRKMHFGLVAALEQSASFLCREYIQKTLVAVPPKIKTVLRPYQQDGFSWLVHLSANGFGGCLADDMGLGKTLQTIALLQHLYDPEEPEKIEFQPKTNPATIPHQFGQLSLFGDDSPENSDNEVSVSVYKEMSAGVSASLIVVPTSLVANWKREIRRFSSLSVSVYSGEQRSKDPWKKFSRYHIILITYGILRRDIELLENYPFNYVILDESQNIKNPDSITYRSVIRLKSKHRLVLTGTPIENSLKDLWAQFNFINPGLLGSADGFRTGFINPITKEGNEKVGKRLQQLIQPFFLRRTKQQVAPELPPLTEEIIYCEMTPEQHDLYQKEKNTLRATLLREWGKSGFVALNGITRLRQLANHPQMLFPAYSGDSGKMEQILDAYETLKSEGHKVLIFSSFVSHLALLADTFTRRGWAYAMLTGSTVDREAEIARFSADKQVSAFFISLKAGGVGLNLTDADYVFIIDPWWNPAAEMQAESRAHRIGQDKQVIVYRFITVDTIEEKIRNLQENKSELAEAFISENDPLKQLTDKEWQELL